MLKRQKLLTLFLLTLWAAMVEGLGKKVTWDSDMWALELQKNRFGMMENLPLQHRQKKLTDKQQKNIKPLVALDKIEAFESMTEEQLKEVIEKIFNNSLSESGDFSVEDFLKSTSKRFFEVVCLNKKILEQYVKWFKDRFISAIGQNLDNKIEEESLDLLKTRLGLQIQSFSKREIARLNKLKESKELADSNLEADIKRALIEEENFRQKEFDFEQRDSVEKSLRSPKSSSNFQDLEIGGN